MELLTMKHNEIVITHEGRDITLTIETGDVLVVCNGRWPLARAIKIVTYLKDRKSIALRAHHTGMFLVSEVTTIVREMDFDPETKRLGDQWTLWDGKKYLSGRAVDRKLVLMKPKLPYLDPEALQRDLESYRGMYAIRRLFAHIYMTITGRRPEQKGAGTVCSEFVAIKLNKHYKEYFNDPQMASPRKVMEALLEDFDVYVLN